MTGLIGNHSDWFRLKLSVAWLIKFLYFLKKTDFRKELTLENLRAAERAIIMSVQGSSFQADIAELKLHGEVKSNSSLKSLNPFVADGILRVGGRLQMSNLPYEMKFPILLPYKNHVTDLIIKHIHFTVGHLGRNTVLAQIHERFWIIKGNRAVRRVLSDCMQCKKMYGREMQQQMAELPAVVSEQAPPFANCGIDCFGPFYIKYKRSQEKRYGLIFVCFAIRAIHIEVLVDMTTDSFLNALFRFVARRGTVQKIFSDRGTNFVGASKVLKDLYKVIDIKNITEKLLKRDVEWIFNPPHSSHFGGMWERQILNVRRIFSILLGKQVLTHDSLSTLFCEIENIINNRPITAVSSDSSDMLPLSPNTLLTMKEFTGIIDVKTDGCNVKSRWKQINHLADVFWKRWTKEYLNRLQRRRRWTKRQRNLAVGDLVLVRDLNLSRNQWPLALVKEVNLSGDGLVRSATLRSGGKDISRPISQLVMLLECDG